MPRFYFDILVVLLISQVSFSQNVYYVSSSGRDSDNGLTTETAFETLQHAAGIAKAGDSIKVLPGNYTGFDIRSNGTFENPVVFKAEGDVVIDQPNSETSQDGINIENASWIIIDGFKVNNQPRAGIRSAVSEFITIRNNYCDNNGRWGIFTGFVYDLLIENNICSASIEEHGIYVSNSGDRPVVRFNRCFENNGSGIQLNADSSMGDDGIITNAVINNNILYNNGNAGSAINLDGVQESLIFNNLIYDNHNTGIALFKIDGKEGSKNNRIYNNTIINATDGRWGIINNNGSSGNTILNNIVINHHSFRGSISVDESSLEGFSSNYNLVTGRFSDEGEENILNLEEWQGLGYDIESEIVDAEDLIFTDPFNNNFHLIPGSQPVDKGTSLVSGIVSHDLDGLLRPQGSGYDIGAYELSGSAGIEETGNPSGFKLLNNYPNPFNPETVISWYMENTDYVIIKVYDVLGREIALLAGAVFHPGLQKIVFNAQELPTGTYFYTLSAGNRSITKKLMLIR